MLPAADPRSSADPSDTRERVAEALDNPTQNFVDLVAVFVAHCLRHELFAAGSDLKTVLKQAALTPGRQIQWKHPQLPLIPRVRGRQIRSPLDLGSPYLSRSVHPTLGRMCRMAGALVDVRLHDIRRAYAKDSRRLAANPMSGGLSLDDVGHSVGHPHRTTTSGVMQNCVSYLLEPINVTRAQLSQ